MDSQDPIWTVIFEELLDLFVNEYEAYKGWQDHLGLNLQFRVPRGMGKDLAGFINIYENGTKKPNAKRVSRWLKEYKNGNHACPTTDAVALDSIAYKVAKKSYQALRVQVAEKGNKAFEETLASEEVKQSQERSIGSEEPKAKVPIANQQLLHDIFQSSFTNLKDFVNTLQIRPNIFKKKIKGKEVFKFLAKKVKDFSLSSGEISRENIDHPLLHAFWTKIHRQYSATLDKYFKLILRICESVESVCDNPIANLEKLRLLRTQWSSGEMVCIHLFSWTSDGKKLREFIFKYNLLEELHMLEFPEFAFFVKKYEPLFDFQWHEQEMLSLKIFVDHVNMSLGLLIKLWSIITSNIENDPNLLETFGFASLEEVATKIASIGSLPSVLDTVGIIGIVKLNSIPISIIHHDQKNSPFAIIDELKEMRKTWADRSEDIDLRLILEFIMYYRLVLKNKYSRMDLAMDKVEIISFRQETEAAPVDYVEFVFRPQDFSFSHDFDFDRKEELRKMGFPI